jgi:hypothetical protein
MNIEQLIRNACTYNGRLTIAVMLWYLKLLFQFRRLSESVCGLDAPSVLREWGLPRCYLDARTGRKLVQG